MTLTKNKLHTMMGLQASMNDKVNPNWRQAGYPWEDAILTEAVEAYDHTHWAWWKNVGRTPDTNQIKMELVDIWHFILSELMTHTEGEGEEGTYYGLVSTIITMVEANKPEDFVPTVDTLRAALKNVMRAALAEDSPDRVAMLLHSFVVAIDVLEMGWDELFKLYVGKNCLNQFRQANGYKKNSYTYKEIWAVFDGREDNEYLTEILAKLDVDSDTFIADINRELQAQFDKNKEELSE